MLVDESESNLGILDLIQVFVEALDKCFETVCELDLVFHFDQVHYILHEMIQGGIVIETNLNDIVANVMEATKRRKKSLNMDQNPMSSLLTDPSNWLASRFK